ncbi:MAG: LEA type 2 family protein, partial [Fulvivirga sp.]|nr:LEA type 2 family protein [Fulvivirga sp.]
MSRFILLLLCVLVVCCQQPEEPPVFKGVDNIRVNKVQGTTAFLNADAHFYNPNDVKMKLKRVDVGVHLDGKPVGLIEESIRVNIPAKSDFKIPLDATFDLKDSGLIKNLLSMLGGKSRTVRYKGYIRVAVH